MNKTTLCYFSSCAVHPDGQIDPFTLQELPWLTRHFDTVLIVSYKGVAALEAGGNEQIVFRKPHAAHLSAWLRTLGSRDFFCEVRRLFSDRKGSPLTLIKLMLFAWRGQKMRAWAEAALAKAGAEDAFVTLYSFWLSFDGYAAALVKRKHSLARFIARGHAFDVDVERNPMNPYLMKQAIADEADRLCFISEAAKAQWLVYMAGRAKLEKTCVLALGSGGKPVALRPDAPANRDGVLRLVSCAMVIEIKQVQLIAEALAEWRGGPVLWTHIGDGEGMQALRELAEQKLDRKENVICELMGALRPEALEKLYQERPFDVFINVSRKEGVPVSIMEAMRFGIPIIAPNVGGIPELVTPEAGLVFEGGGAREVLTALERFAALPRPRVEAMRLAAWERWNQYYSSEKLLPSLFDTEA